MILYCCDREGCTSQISGDSSCTEEWHTFGPLDGLMPDKHYCCRGCAVQDMAGFEVPQEIPHV